MLLPIMFALAILSIGLDQYRPFLGSVGNLSDVLFGLVFLVAVGEWFFHLNAERVRQLGQALRESELFVLAGLMLTAGGIVASLGSDAPAASWNVTIKYAVFGIWMLWAPRAIRKYLSVERAYALYVLGFCGIGVATLLDVLAGTHFGATLVTTPVYQVNFDEVRGLLRYGGPTGHSNTLGYISAIGILLCLPAAVAGGFRRASIPLLGLMSCGVALLISGSRAALVGVAVGCVVLVAIGGRTRARRLALVIVASLGLLWTVPAAAGFGPELNPAARLLESLQPRRDYGADWERRRDLMLTRKFLDHDPLTGYGMEDIGTAPHVKQAGFKLPHWVLLQSWVAGGLLGLVGAFGFYVAALMVGWRAVRAGHALALGLFSVCLAFVIMDQVHPALEQRFKWFAVALLMAINATPTLSPTQDSVALTKETPVR